AYLREHDGRAILCVANLARTPQAVELELGELQGRIPVELDGGTIFPPIGALPYLLTLPPYGFYWFSLEEEAAWPSQHTPAPELMPDYETLVMRRGLAEALLAARHSIERDVLPPYLGKRRWYAMKDQTLNAARLALLTPLPDPDLLLAEIETDTPAGTARWLLPLGIAWEDRQPAPLPAQLALARVRRGARVGLLTDAFALAELAHSILNGLSNGSTIRSDDGEIRFLPTAVMREVTVPPDADMNWLSAEQSNSSVIVGDVAILKLFRRVSDGPHPEAEMGRYLTEQGFSGAAALLGEMVRVGTDGVSHALAIAQSFVRNQGDAFTWTLDLLLRHLSDLAGGDETAAADAERHEDYDAFARLLGCRLGEMHAILARETDNPDFAPVPATHEMAAQWGQQAERQLAAAFAALESQHEWSESATHDMERLAAARESLTQAVHRLAAAADGAVLTRIHGDLHLGQVLVANGAVYIIDFEGEPAKPVEVRRAKNSRLRDVAGMIRSFDYAAAVVERKSRESQAHLADARRTTFLDSFITQATNAFLAGYREAMHITDEAGEQKLLDLFLVEKAAYEVAYEAANRPTWIEVPLRGLARLADELLGGAASE
ncbi:MAG TPA: putative maltokinase, partial [Acetobacteraceae bacterium]|nr:putative maltokinase [Acetobacteraceae bacterium]